ncbi:MAG TPA: hypothetical protein VIV11_26705 [Kofleriaceae bacterium]
MIRLILFALVLSTSCGDGGSGPSTCIRLRNKCPVVIDADATDAFTGCNPLTQTGCSAGEKCTWLLAGQIPNYVGIIRCAPVGTAEVGEACQFGAAGATGYDGCEAGAVCDRYDGIGRCVQLCDVRGGAPMCDARRQCVVHADYFKIDRTPPNVGLCDE